MQQIQNIFMNVFFNVVHTIFMQFIQPIHFLSTLYRNKNKTWVTQTVRGILSFIWSILTRQLH